MSYVEVEQVLEHAKSPDGLTVVKLVKLARVVNNAYEVRVEQYHKGWFGRMRLDRAELKKFQGWGEGLENAQDTFDRLAEHVRQGNVHKVFSEQEPPDKDQGVYDRDPIIFRD
jgi:hypothetical protein